MSPVWKKPAGVVGGATLSLDDIENVKLRAPTVSGLPAGERDAACWVLIAYSYASMVMRPKCFVSFLSYNHFCFVCCLGMGLFWMSGLLITQASCSPGATHVIRYSVLATSSSATLSLRNLNLRRCRSFASRVICWDTTMSRWGAGASQTLRLRQPRTNSSAFCLKS